MFVGFLSSSFFIFKSIFQYHSAKQTFMPQFLDMISWETFSYLKIHNLKVLIKHFFFSKESIHRKKVRSERKKYEYKSPT